MFKEIYGFNPDVFTTGTAIKIEDNHQLPKHNQFLGIESKYDYYRENLTGSYLVKLCYVNELWLTNTYGEEYRISLRHVNGDQPRLKILLLTR